MKKNRIRLTESQLHRVIKESVNKILREADEQPYYEEQFLSKTEDDLLDDFRQSTHLAYAHLLHVKRLNDKLNTMLGGDDDPEFTTIIDNALRELSQHGAKQRIYYQGFERDRHNKPFHS